MLMVVGVLLRVVNLEQRIYWVDEVATSIRISGYTAAEVTQHLATGEPLTVEDLQRYQTVRGDRPWGNTLQALTQSPEHAPLYFIMARLWAQQWGSSVAAMRSLSVVVSVVSLPAFIWLCRELCLPRRMAWFSAGLLAISPFFIAYAQEARPYSLWTLTLIVTSGALLRALRLNTLWAWSGYVVALVMMLYTSLLSVFVTLGLSIYGVFASSLITRGQLVRVTKHRRWCRHYFLGSTALGVCALVPWLVVVALRWETLHSNTTWMREPMVWWARLGIWLYSLAVLIFDVPVSLDASWATAIKVAIALVVLSLMGYALYTLCRTTSRQVGVFVATLTGTTPLVLIAIDLMLNGQVSTAARYLIPCHLGFLMAIAYLFDLKMSRSDALESRLWWQRAAIGVIGLCLMSSLSHWNEPAKYQKSRNLSNPAIATILNRTDDPVVLAEPSQTIDLLSLSYLLDADITIQIAPTPHLIAELPSDLNQTSHLFVFNPSPDLQRSIRGDRQLRAVAVYQPQQLISAELALSLWQLIPI